jgi:uncharacterized membrane protein YhaH (DUF805 family)
MKQLVLAGRVIFGAWMLANGVNHFFLSLWPMPTGHEPLAIQLMSAFVNSRLIDVAMAIQLVGGALILTGVLIPVALCVVAPVLTCAVYWTLILDHQPLNAVLALAALALNGLLMLAYIDYYRGALQRHAFPFGEAPGGRLLFDVLFVNPNGRTSRSQFVPALLTLVAVVAFYQYFVTGRTAQWCVAVLLFPAIILFARRLHDMGFTAWLLLVPGGLMVAAFGIWLKLASFGAQVDAVLPLIALAVTVAFAIWGCIGKSQAEANKFGAPVPA